VSETSLAGFVVFLQTVVGFSTTVLPADDLQIEYAYCVAKATINYFLRCLPSIIYRTALYNLATDTLINVAMDQPGSCFFEDLRRKMGMTQFVGGVIKNACGQGTQESLDVPIGFNNLTIADLQNLKTPYGRVYLGIAQSYGPSLWGIS
jgi:hypothetical protein